MTRGDFGVSQSDAPLGTPRREFLHVDDLADAVVHLMRTYSAEAIVNVGTGLDLTILELARLVVDVIGYSGRIVTDPEKPDGTPRKLLDVGRLNSSGWKPRILLREGVRQTYQWFVAHQASLRL